MKEEEILRQQPFRTIFNSILKIERVELLSSETSFSGETFKVTSQTGRNYKLRYCKGLLKARKIERNVKLFPNAFPRFYGREGRYLLFDWIEGHTLSLEVSAKDCYRIGKLMGEIHAREETDTTQNADHFFRRILKNISFPEIFEQNILAKIQLKYRELKKKMKIDIVLEFDDIHQNNFISDKMRIYFIDEEGIDYQIKGLGLAKPFLIKKWVKSKEQQEAFWKGYHEHHSSDYFDLDYQLFLTFVQCLRKIGINYNRGSDYSKEKEMILGMLQ